MRARACRGRGGHRRRTGRKEAAGRRPRLHYIEYVEQGSRAAPATRPTTRCRRSADDDLDDPDGSRAAGRHAVVAGVDVSPRLPKNTIGSAPRSPSSRPRRPIPTGSHGSARQGSSRVASSITNEADRLTSGRLTEVLDRRLLLPPQPAGSGAAPRDAAEHVGRATTSATWCGARRDRPHRWRRSRPTTPPRSWGSTTGCNSRTREAELRRRTNLRWLGVASRMIDPDSTYIDTTVHIGADVTLFPGTLLQGRTVIGEGSRDRPRRPARRLCGRRRCRVENTVGRLTPRWATMPKSGPTRRWRRATHLIARYK